MAELLDDNYLKFISLEHFPVNIWTLVNFELSTFWYANLQGKLMQISSMSETSKSILIQMEKLCTCVPAQNFTLKRKSKAFCCFSYQVYHLLSKELKIN